MTRLNPNLPEEALEEALHKVAHASAPSLIQANRTFHRMLTEGVEVEVLRGGEVRGLRVRLVDFDDPEANDCLAVNQFTVVEGHHERRLDVVVFVNGLPLTVIELTERCSCQGKSETLELGESP